MVCSLVGALLTGGLLVAALDRAGIGHERTHAASVATVLARIAHARDTPRGKPLVVFLGDSLLVDWAPPDRSIPERLGRLLLAPPHIRVRTVVDPGLTLFSFYFASAELIEMRPSIIVLPINLWTLSEGWLRGRPELSGLLPLGAWMQSPVSLDTFGLSLDRVLLYRALLVAGGVELWGRLQGEQVRFDRGRRALEARLQSEVFRRVPGELPVQPDGPVRLAPRRISAAEGRARFDRVMDGLEADSTYLRVMDQLLASFRASGIAVVVYVAPINVEHVTAIGAYDRDRISSAMARLEAVCQERGATFLDFHALLPDEAFVDAGDHLDHANWKQSSLPVATLLEPYVRARTARGRPAAGGPSPSS